jgi:hypothetical protein
MAQASRSRASCSECPTFFRPPHPTADLRELMERIGNASSRAALIYLHSTDDRQRALAEAVSQRAQRDLAGESAGTPVARGGQTDESQDGLTRSRDPPDLR